MKYALITGGSRGIGRAIAIKLAQNGYHILIIYKGNDEAAAQAKNMVQAQNVSCDLLKLDVTQKQETESAINLWIENNKEKQIEILVNNAGIRQDNLMIFMSNEQWHDVLSTSLDSFFYVTKSVINPMLARKFGRIINVVSLSGIKGMPGQVNYSAAKAGLIGATKALAQEVARRGVTVNAVAPGFIKTDMTSDLNEKELASLIPMKRFGTPEEVAEVVSFLASSASSYVTGEVISINGGLYT